MTATDQQVLESHERARRGHDADGLVGPSALEQLPRQRRRRLI